MSYVIRQYSGPFHVGYKFSLSFLHVIGNYERHSINFTSV